MCAVSYLLFVVLFNEENGLGEGIDLDEVELVRIRQFLSKAINHTSPQISKKFFWNC